ncbi:hypothetical protein A2U01_0082121, partial [Trifolium medium]|nr:hypothetical protein [Trifolium medium]
WRKEHYLMAPDEFVFKLGELTPEERADYKRLETFVERLPHIYGMIVRVHPCMTRVARE